ncbi:MAG: hypothetical protein Q8S33_22945 [Myxococcales bacterium]|nr:hypothetical protein [Myxococcales bacterium]
MSRRSALPLAFLLLAVAGGVYRAMGSSADELQAAESRTPTPMQNLVVAPVIETPEPLPSAEVDAGAPEPALEHRLAERGAMTTTPPRGFDLDAYVAKWRAALSPLLSGRPPDKRTTLRAANPGTTFATQPDGGVGPCVAGELFRGIALATQVDVFVFIDTSGSMSHALPALAQWLGSLEFTLREAARDYQLVVVADRRAMFLGEARARTSTLADAGFLDEFIGSSDIFDVLLRSGESPGGWRSMVRDGVATEVVLITDDSPPRGPPTQAYGARWTTLLGAALSTTRLHVLGGFEVGPSRVLSAEAPLSRTVCRPHGVSLGLEYQRLSKAHRGVRASLCEADSLRELLRVVLDVPPPQSPCRWDVEVHPAARLREPRAVTSSGFTEPLLREYSEPACAGLRRSYLLRDTGVTLCPSTCAALREEGFKGIELSWTCP